MSFEIELKFRIPAARLAALRRALATPSAVVDALAAVYFDTPGEHLAQARVALRLRLEAGRWVQTLKAEGATAMQRLEHNVAVPGGPGQRPALDVARHHGSLAGAVLARVLARAQAELRQEARQDARQEARQEVRQEVRQRARDSARPESAAGSGAVALVERCATGVRRTRRVLRHGTALIELALDEGQIRAGSAVCAVCEIEFELLRGPPQALLDVAGRWVSRFGLVLDVRSKSERGHRLAQGQSASPPTAARPLKLARRASPAQALAAMLANPLGQVLANASQMADDGGQPEHLHQLRVGLRRLRSVLHVFGPLSTPASSSLPAPPTVLAAPAAPTLLAAPAAPAALAVASLATRLAALFGQLGAARDQDAMAEWLWPALQAAGAPPLRQPPRPPANPAADVATLLRAPATQHLWLALLGACQPVVVAPDAAPDAAPDDAPPTSGPASPPPPAPPALHRLLRQPLRQRYRQVQRDAARFDALDDADRHRLRRRIKRLRYATELSAALWPARQVQRLLRGLARAQAPLGEFNDTVVALAHCQALAAHDGAAWFAVGWLSARREALAPLCSQALARLARRPGCWRRR